MFCGSGSFSRVDEDPCSPPTPRGSRRKHGSSNPYSTRGLDKFSTVLADLHARREKVMAQAGAQGASLVRFVYSNSHDWIPIVVREPQQQPNRGSPRSAPLVRPRKSRMPPPPRSTPSPAAPNRAVKKGFSWKVLGRGGLGFLRWRLYPSSYWPLMVALILLCLVFGRAFTICCTSVCWYLLPCMNGDESLNEKKSVKDYGRNTREKKQQGAGGGEGAVTPAQEKKEGDLVGLAGPSHHRKSSAKKRQS